MMVSDFPAGLQDTTFAIPAKECYNQDNQILL